MGIKIFNAFLVLFASVILFLLPLTDAIYDFRTEERTNTFSTTTGLGETTANVTLFDDLYDCDLGSVDIDSDNSTDNPVASSINCTTREMTVTGLSANVTRALDVTYDIDALGAFDSINTLLDRLPFIWMLMIIAFAPAGLFAIFTRR